MSCTRSAIASHLVKAGRASSLLLPLATLPLYPLVHDVTLSTGLDLHLAHPDACAALMTLCLVPVTVVSVVAARACWRDPASRSYRSDVAKDLRLLRTILVAQAIAAVLLPGAAMVIEQVIHPSAIIGIIVVTTASLTAATLCRIAADLARCRGQAAPSPR